MDANNSLSINLGHIASMCREEWSALVDDIHLEPIPERQDLRGFFLNWVAAFIPEAFPNDLRLSIESWLRDFEEEDSSPFGWSKVLLVRATLFALTDNVEWLRIHRA